MGQVAHNLPMVEQALHGGRVFELQRQQEQTWGMQSRGKNHRPGFRFGHGHQSSAARMPVNLPIDQRLVCRKLPNIQQFVRLLSNGASSGDMP
ncbi:hypothetical protein NZ708_12980 [Pseudomonas syringae pv. actinidiae ICMP 18708]|nr:hypothetical protein IYO_013000 [Pseudomonas syringae pv. actinidiae ICMP 18884]AOE56863.1 hypothetical protein NZ708_12980 [Pseudomonas syringae pv. actinidiae ICMP 18708]APP97823.1 hypothetical protein PsaNZ45_13530 [Pseudomonas syringae pv. actinidiae]APQ03576.1 hypothetical protein PsaNZ47_12975 [Pseudomonas syringae pv. actinidiae]OKS50857.1 hypothetical protein PsaNZ66_20220 [Pseudomonas syringae pv. actinidiae]